MNMKKQMVALVALSSVWFVMAAQTAKDEKKLTEEERAARREMALKVQGGFIKKPGMQKGRVSIITAQKEVERSSLDAVAELLAKAFKIQVDVKDGVVEAPNGSAAALKRDGANACVVVGSCKGWPALLAAPDERWAFVNVDALKGGDVAGRTQKEVVRGFAFVCGAASSQRPNSLLDAQMADLDRLDLVSMVEIPGDVNLRIGAYLKTIGVTPWRNFTYKRACIEGWAPAPTNEYQKAIWDKIHEMPTEPIKIKPETKKVER